jgi:hypothetical protein
MEKQRQTLHVLIHVKPKIIKVVEAERKMVVTRAGGGWEDVGQRVRGLRLIGGRSLICCSA